MSGQSASTAETPDNGRFVLLRQGNRIHGAFGASTLEHGLHAEGPYRVWMQIMTDGTVAAVLGGRARASGTAFGEVELSFATAGVKRARYVRVEDGELFPCPGGTLSEGADLDAVEALGIAGPGQ